MYKLYKFSWLFLLGIANAHAALVVIVDGEIQETSTKVTLNADYHEIIFQFPDTPQCHYQYRLENLENDWKISNFSSIRYTNLDGGNYVFHGKTIVSNRVIANYTFQVEIKENFWEKWWFIGFLSLTIISIISLLIYFWFLYDFRQRMKVEGIRHRIAADLHDEIGANLNSITFITEMLRKQSIENEKTDMLLEKISNNSLESATLISDTIWSLNPNYDSFGKLIERVKSFSSGILASKDVAFSIENRLESANFEMSIEQRRNLFLIMKEAINNIAKHAKANKVQIEIEQKKHQIQIKIIDDGQGFDTKITAEGNGLVNIKNREIENEIQVNIHSELGKGTTLEIILNIQN